MIVTSPDPVSLATALTYWEWAEYVFSALVTVGCFGEYVAEFTHWWTDENKKKRLSKRSLLLLASALALELVCLVQTNRISGMLTGSLRDEAAAADSKAQSAMEKANAATTIAGDAEGKSSLAADEAAKAQNTLTAVDERATTIGRNLSQMAEALRQPALSADDEKRLADALALCPGRDTTPVLVHHLLTNSLGISIFDALQGAGFKKATIAIQRLTFIGVSIHGSMADMGVTDCIAGALVKGLPKGAPLFGMIGVSDPVGSPITIEVGDRPIGALPK
jgi:hypothetical protein